MRKNYFFPLDSKGYVINIGDLKKIKSKQKRMLSDITVLCTKELKTNLLSIMVRGSISNGQDIDFVSDADIIVVIRKKISSKKHSRLISESEIIHKKYPHITMIDLFVVTYFNLLKAKKYSELRANLITSSVCWFGVNILLKIDKVKPGKMFIKETYGDLDKQLKKLKGIFSGRVKTPKYLDDVMPISFWCVWTMRLFLRSGLALTMEFDPVYSRDLLTCKRVFSKYFPDYKKEINQAYKWAIKPINDKIKLYNYTNNFGKVFLKIYKEITN